MTYRYWRLLPALLLSTTVASAAEPFVVHEWGTFTSFQSSQGFPLYGLQRGDEPLPNFVWLRNPTSEEPSHSPRECRRNSYSCDFAPTYLTEPVAHYHLGVNQRMETPVIYFHSDTARQVRVTVDFPQGLITEWYPKATSFQPAIGRVESISGGTMTWDVNVRTDRVALPSVGKGSIWAPSREVNANDITAGGENERLVFYRGVGDFSTNFRAAAEAGTFQLHNQNLDDQIPEVIYIHVTENGGFVRSLGKLGAAGQLPVSYASTSFQNVRPMSEYVANAAGLVHKALMNTGLYDDEARAMVNTWKHAYFETKGERFLYILPRSETDSLLPMTLSPAPDSLERVLVGRVEVMNLEEQNKLFDRLHAAAQGKEPIFTRGMGPFAEQLLVLANGLVEVRLAAELVNTPDFDKQTALRIRYRRTVDALTNAIVDIQSR